MGDYFNLANLLHDLGDTPASIGFLCPLLLSSLVRERAKEVVDKNPRTDLIKRG